MLTYQIKYGYTPGDEFTLNNSNYIGAYNVYSDSTVYTGKFRQGDSAELTSSTNFAADLIRSKYFKDRHIVESSSLPNTLENIILGTGETVNYVSLNRSIRAVHDNLTFLYSKMFLGDTDLPYNYSNIAAIQTVAIKDLFQISTLSAISAPLTADSKFLVADINSNQYGIRLWDTTVRNEDYTGPRLESTQTTSSSTTASGDFIVGILSGIRVAIRAWNLDTTISNVISPFDLTSVSLCTFNTPLTISDKCMVAPLDSGVYAIRLWSVADQTNIPTSTVVYESPYKWYSTENYAGFDYTLFSETCSYLAAYADMDNLKRFVVVPSKREDTFNIFGITDTRLIALTSTSSFTKLSIVLYTDVIDNNSNEKCEHLTDITSDGHYLYVSDDSINKGGQIFRYNISSYINNDPVYEYKRFLIEPIGGLGGSANVDRFNKPTVLGSKAGAILVYDSGNNVIKVYDDTFVWKRTINISSKVKYTILDIRYRKLNDHFYFLFKDDTNNQFGMFECDNQYKLTKAHVFNDVLYAATDVGFKRLVISEQDSNVFYLITDSNIFKKFFSSPGESVAAYNRSKFGLSPIFLWNSETIMFKNEQKKWNSKSSASNPKINDIEIIPSSTGEYDNLLILGKSVIYNFKEKIAYNSVLKNTNPNYYNLENIIFENTENVQSLVFNKEFYKIFTNLNKIKNNLKGKFLYEYNFYGDLVYKKYEYFTSLEIDIINLEQSLNNYINDNELVHVGVINRILKNIYNIQVKLLEVTKPVITNFKTRVGTNNIYYLT